MANMRLPPVIFAYLLAATASAAPPTYPGTYSSGGVDSVQQLVLLEDHTFCYAVMAGSLDLMAGGHWQDAVNPADGIELQEVKAKRTVFPALLSEASADKGKVSFDFHGHSFSAAELAAFSFSDSDTNPVTMRPLFPEDKNGWSPSYALPSMDAEKARYVFLAHAVPRSYDNQQPDGLSVTVYSLEAMGGEVRIGFDRVQAMPALRLHAQLLDDELSLQGEPFGNREPLTADLADAVRRDCITPALSNDQPTTETPQPGIRRLVPLRSFTLPLDAVQGTPWFPYAGGD